MEYKYENIENVEAKRDFEVFRHDENGELIGAVTVPKGTKGKIQSMGWSSADNFKVSYDIQFVSGPTEIEIGLYEEEIELYLNLDVPTE